MSSASENLNNAIATIGPLTDQSSPDVRKAVSELELHWGKFWQSNERAMLPDPALAPKLTRYVQWYTRAWMLLPPERREKAVSPNDLDTSWQNLAVDTLKQHADSIVHVNKAANQLARDIGTGVANVASKTANYTLWAMGGVIAILLLKGKRGRR